jgi:hypothetical protein
MMVVACQSLHNAENECKRNFFLIWFNLTEQWLAPEPPDYWLIEIERRSIPSVTNQRNLARAFRIQGTCSEQLITSKTSRSRRNRTAGKKATSKGSTAKSP